MIGEIWKVANYNTYATPEMQEFRGFEDRYCSIEQKDVRKRTSLLKHSEQSAQSALQISPVDDEIQKAMLENELGALKTFWQVFTNGLTNNARSGETNECIWFCNVEVTKHRIRCSDTTGSWIGEQ